RREYADVGLVMKRGRAQDRVVALEVFLRMRRHHAAQRRPHRDNPHAVADFERTAYPLVLDERVVALAGVDENRRTEAARFENRTGRGEFRHMPQRATGDQVHHRAVEKTFLVECEKVGHRGGGKPGKNFVDRHVAENGRRVDSGELGARGGGALEAYFSAERRGNQFGCVCVLGVNPAPAGQLDCHRRHLSRRGRRIAGRAKFEEPRELLRAGDLPRRQLSERVRAIADRAPLGEMKLVELLTEHRLNRVARERADLANHSPRHRGPSTCFDCITWRLRRSAWPRAARSDSGPACCPALANPSVWMLTLRESPAAASMSQSGWARTPSESLPRKWAPAKDSRLPTELERPPSGRCQRRNRTRARRRDAPDNPIQRSPRRRR